MNTEKLLHALVSLHEKDRAHAYVEWNSYKWPEALSEFKPEGWDALNSNDRYNHPGQRLLAKLLDLTVSEFMQSNQWWEEKCGGTKGHETWFIEHHKIPKE